MQVYERLYVGVILANQVLLEFVQTRVKELVELDKPAAINVTTSQDWKTFSCQY